MFDFFPHDDTAERNTQFFNACRTGDFDTAKEMLEKGADIDTTRSDVSALFVATENKHRDIAIFLLENNAMAHTSNLFGWSALHSAVQQQDTELVSLLLEKGAFVSHAADRSKETALMVACQHPSMEITKILLGKGANVRSIDKQGNTALHHAAKAGQADMCSELLSRGASASIANKDSQTPLSLSSTQQVTMVLEAQTALSATSATPAAESGSTTDPAITPKRRILRA